MDKTEISNFWIVDLLGKSLEDVLSSPNSKQVLEPSKHVVVEDDYYIDSEENGTSFLFDKKKRLVSVFFFSKGHQGYNEYVGGLFDGLKFNLSREEVENIYKNIPKTEGGGIFHHLFGKIPHWIKYNIGDYSLHFEFGENEKISMITLLCNRH